MRYRNFAFAVFVGLLCSCFGVIVNAQSTRLQPGSVEARSVKKVVHSEILEDLKVESEKTAVEPGKTFAVGRVTDIRGRGVRTAAVTLYCLDSSEVFHATSNAFGFYQLKDLEPGNYLIAIQHRSYIFVTGSMSFTIESEPVEINFQAERAP